MTDAERFFEIVQHLNPNLNSAVQMLSHHVRQGSSFVVQLWGPKGTGKQKLVDIIKQKLSHDRMKAEIPELKRWGEIFIDFDNEKIPNSTTRKRYSQLFLSAVVEAMKEHKYGLSTPGDRPSQESDADSADSVSSLSTDDSEDSSLLHRVSSEGKRKRGSYMPQPSLSFPGAAHMSEEKRSFLQSLCRAPTRHIVSEIIKILRSLCSEKNRVIIVLRRFDRCVQLSEKLMYGLLNYISDSSSSIVLITTTHFSTVDLEKRISSRYNPFRLPVSLGSEDTPQRILDSVCTTKALAQAASKSGVANRMKSNLAEKMCDAGLTVQLLCLCLARVQNKKKRPIDDAMGSDDISSESFTQLSHRFDPLLRFYTGLSMPQLYTLFEKEANLTPIGAVKLIFPWIEHVRALIRECVVVIVALSISFERTSGAGRMFPRAQKARSLLLGNNSWLNNRPPGKQTSWFSIDYLIRSIFPLEGGVLNFKKYGFANHDTMVSWLCSGSCYEGLLWKYGLEGGKSHNSNPTVTDEVWMHTLVWLIVEYGLLHQPNPSMVALSFPPHHCIYVIRQRLQNIASDVKSETKCFQSSQTKNSEKKLMSNCMDILKAVEREIRWISETFDEYIENLTKTRNAS
ncbi:hypothetical protein XU18_0299 [Perkinsela sp. CCAP 1560/4]|nr:hypothetical protein XU18_0299 [Perkinsela sp. CCAP 1560/4]|eukprot:KNH09614.1 hypothetical protein XU18_0299 [Perkinsela sp. CCAP 1560/4]